MPVAAIGYVRIETGDTDAWMHFGTAILGLMEAPRAEPAMESDGRVSESLIAFYPFSEGSGRMTADQSGVGAPSS